MEAYLIFPKKQPYSFLTWNQTPTDDRPILVIADNIANAAKDYPDAGKVTVCLVKEIVIKQH